MKFVRVGLHKQRTTLFSQHAGYTLYYVLYLGKIGIIPLMTDNGFHCLLKCIFLTIDETFSVAKLPMLKMKKKTL